MEVDTEAKILFGTVIDMTDVITFQGETIESTHQAFKDSIEDYLEFCAELGRDPEKPFSGKLHLRTQPEIHRQIFRVAKRQGVSINTWIEQVLEQALAKETVK